MGGIRPLIVCAVVGWFGLSANVSHAALAKAKGGSGLSAKLSSNKAIRKQQLIADPSDPDSGSTSVLYDPSIVTVSAMNFGPGYSGQAMVEVNNDGDTFLQDFSQFLTAPAGTETGYVQVGFFTPVTRATHGQISVAEGYTTVDQGGPASVDTHGIFFNYLQGVTPGTVATYKIYADAGGRSSENSADFLDGFNADGSSFHVDAADIAPITVRGSLSAVPLPPAAVCGGLMLVGMFTVQTIRRRRTIA